MDALHQFPAPLPGRHRSHRNRPHGDHRRLVVEPLLGRRGEDVSEVVEEVAALVGVALRQLANALCDAR